MSIIFISHSSNDKDFARKLFGDLTDAGHSPWLDEYSIKVGESIPDKINKGIQDCEYLILVLSPQSVKSSWVTTEWEAKYWQEVSSGKIMLLPLLLQDCEIPAIIKPKKYADFRKNYSVGFAQLIGAITPIIESFPPENFTYEKTDTKDIEELIELAQTPKIPLSQVFAKALPVAIRLNHTDFIDFCRLELSGYKNLPKDEIVGDIVNRLGIKYRVIEMFWSPVAQINLQSIHWNQNPSTIMEYMRNNKDFFPWKMLVPESISEVEKASEKCQRNTLITVRMNLHDILPDPNFPNCPVHGYSHPSSYLNILDATRANLTSYLINLLPGNIKV